MLIFELHVMLQPVWFYIKFISNKYFLNTDACTSCEYTYLLRWEMQLDAQEFNFVSVLGLIFVISLMLNILLATRFVCVQSFNPNWISTPQKSSQFRILRRATADRKLLKTQSDLIRYLFRLFIFLFSHISEQKHNSPWLHMHR